MMTLDEFVTQYAGQWLSYTVGFKGECVQLMRRYVADVLALPQIPGVTSAFELWDKAQAEHWERIPNHVDNWPEAGDVVIWGTRVGQYGHVAVALAGADVHAFMSFDQNWPLHSPAHVQAHDYHGVLGWLRPTRPDPMAWLVPYLQTHGIDARDEPAARARLDALFAGEAIQ